MKRKKSVPGWVIPASVAGLALGALAVIKIAGALPYSGDDSGVHWRTTAEPSSIDTGETAQGERRRSCRFDPGQMFSVNVSMSAKSVIDMGRVTSGGVNPLSPSDTARDVAVDAAWHLDMTALDTLPDGSTVLAARIAVERRDVSEGNPREGATGDISPTFLLKMAQNCALTEFARYEDADVHGARTQQALMLSLQWQYPLDGGVGRYSALERDATGSYRARYLLVEGTADQAVLRRNPGYDKLHLPERAGDSPANLRVEGKGLTVHPGSGPWFDDLSLEQTADMVIAGTQVGRTETNLTARSQPPRGEMLRADLSDPKWIWGDLLSIPPLEAAADLPEVPEWIRNLSLQQAIAGFNELASNPNAKFRDWVDLMRDWIRSHPEQIPDLIQALKNGSFEKLQAEPAVFFAMALVDSPGTRVALAGMMDDTACSALNRSRAAFALAGSKGLTSENLETMIALSREDSSEPDSNREAMTAMLGIVASQQKNANPKLADAARNELLSRLDTETDPTGLSSVLGGIGNIGDDSVLEPATRFLGDDDRTVRAAAAYAMRGVSPEKAADLYGSTMQMEMDPEIRGTLTRAYYEQAIRSHRGPMEPVILESISALASETDGNVIGQLVNLLGLAAQRGSSAARDALTQRMQEELSRQQRNLELLQLLGQYL